MKNKIKFLLIIMFTLPVIAGMELQAQDWPQWRGQDRTGVSKETGLNLDWTQKKPSLSWTFRQAGFGYSAPTIVGTTLYCQGGSNGKDFAFALDTKTGNLKWKQDLGEEFVDPGNRGNGPRGSVTVDGGKLYLIRGGGQIHCLSATDGKMLWQKDFATDFGGKFMTNNYTWGVSESPLVDGNLVICSPGGENGTMVALDKNTGAVIWRSKEWTDPASFASAIVAEVGGIRQFIQQSNKGVAGVSAKDGKLLWKVNYSVARAMSAVIPTPIFNDNMVYVTNGYSGGCMGIKLSKEGEGIKADTIYANKVISNKHGNVVLMNGYIYGHTESGSWVCQNIKTGDLVWSQTNRDAGTTGNCSLFGIADRLLCFDEKNGLLVVAAASPDGWKEFGRMEIPERMKDDPSMDRATWTHPVVANGNLYLRDHDLLFCFDLKK